MILKHYSEKLHFYKHQKTMLLCLFIMQAFTLHSQTKTITGKVLVENQPVENVHVLNLSKEKSTITNAEGMFFMEVDEGDLLTFTAVQLDFWRKSIDSEIFESGKMTVKMTAKTDELEGVEVVQYTKINAYDLGITQKRIVTMTPANRRLYTAQSGLDGLFNAITGRTSMLKKVVENERMEMLADKIELMFDDIFFTENLKIPEDYIRGFINYCSNDLQLASLVNAKKIKEVEFLLTDKATAFKSFYDNFKNEKKPEPTKEKTD